MRTITVLFLTALCAAVPLSSSTTCPSVVFTPQQSRADGPWSIHNLETVDYDGDGVLDLVGLIDSTNTSASAVLNLWHGAGDGTFAVPVSLGDAGISDLEIADVNGDGRKDLVMTSTASTPQILVRLGNGTGFNTAVSTDLSISASRLVVLGFDGDSNLDAVVSGGGNYIGIYKGNGNGTFSQVRLIGTRQYPSSVAAADFDGDGRVDLAYGSLMDNTLDVLFQNVDGSMASPLTLVSGTTPVSSLQDFPSGLAVADFDENGRPDLVVANWEQEGPSASIVLFLNGGNRTFSRSVMAPRLPFISGTFSSVRAIDVNGDGHSDIATTSVNGGLFMVYTGKGNGTFYSPTYYKDPSVHVSSAAIGDFDGDGCSDAALGALASFVMMKGACATQVYAFTEALVITTGDTAPIRAIVSGIGSDTPLPRGNVVFREGATIFGTVDVDATGYAALDVPSLTTGTHTLFGDFAGASSARSQNITQKVITGSSTIAIHLPPQPSVHGSPYALEVAIADEQGRAVYTWFTLDIDGVKSRRTNGSPVTVYLNAGPHTLKAYWEGTSASPRCVSAPRTVETAKADPVVALAGSQLTVRDGQPNMVNLGITGPAGATGPTGSVELRRGTSLLAASALSNGSATLSTTLARGSHDLQVVYSGDANFNSATVDVTLSVLPNVPLAIDARSLQNSISIRAALPNDCQSAVLNRRVAGTGTWSVVEGWSPDSEFDTAATRGALYEYRLTVATASGSLVSNIDPAMLFTDDPVVAGSSVIRRRHFEELRTAVNGVRTAAGLPAFEFDGSWAGATIQASHLAGLRNALAEARLNLGIVAPTFTDDAASGTVIKAVHVQELRRQIF